MRRPARIPCSLPAAVVAVAAVACVAGLPACSYDFDAPFQGTPPGTSSDSGAGGVGGAEAGSGGGGTGGSAGIGGSSDGGGSGGSAGSGGTGASGGTGGSTGSEDCLNGLDDDQDGLVNCADPDCTAVTTCMAAVPAGWAGPFWLDSQPWSNPAPAAKSCMSTTTQSDGPPGAAQHAT